MQTKEQKRIQKVYNETIRKIDELVAMHKKDLAQYIKKLEQEKMKKLSNKLKK